MAIGMYYPKGRCTITKYFPIARTDSATVVGGLPKDAIVVGAYVISAGACAGTTATISLGYSGTAGAYVNAFNVSTADAGYHAVAGAAGSALIAGTKLTADKGIISTYAAGDSSETTGSLGYIKLEYMLTGSGESVTG